jgi:hypothetical protein
MLSTSADGLTVFCDWLDATTPPGEEYRIRSELTPLLCSAGCDKATDDLLRFNGGSVKFQGNSKWFKVGFSGQVIALLRMSGLWETVLSVIGEGPHRVTRVDAAVDLPLDGAIALQELQAAYPRGEVRLSQRPVRITELTATRSDGAKTGTWYAGHRGASEVTCRVYDKANEALEKRGELLPPTTRCELTVCKGVSPTLRDAAQPERLFWHYMSPAVLRRPEGVPEWSSGWGEGWTMTRVEILPAGRLKRRIQESPELAAILEIADSMGPSGRDYALRLIQDKFARDSSASSLASSQAATSSAGS